MGHFGRGLHAGFSVGICGKIIFLGVFAELVSKMGIVMSAGIENMVMKRLTFESAVFRQYIGKYLKGFELVRMKCILMTSLSIWMYCTKGGYDIGKRALRFNRGCPRTRIS